MDNFYKMKLEGACRTIWSIAEEASAISKEKDIDVVFTFNGVDVSITPRSEITSIVTVTLRAVQDGHKKIYC